MTVIDKLPAAGTISAARGVLDYACHRGTMYVRAWPRKPTLPRSPAVQATIASFTAQTRAIAQEAPEIRAAELAVASHVTWTYQDAAFRAAYGLLSKINQ